MKKNAMLKIAAVLLVAVLLTTCAISSTFAKYVSTDDDVTAKARVAKWGIDVEVSASGDLFKKSYSTTDGAVISGKDPQDNVIAPGTTGSETFTIDVSGTAPEVTFMIDYTATAAVSGFGNYCPIQFTISDGTNVVKVNEAGTLSGSAVQAALNDALDDIFIDVESVEANTTDSLDDYDKQVIITWLWPFENGAGQSNADDSTLGDLAVDSDLTFEFVIGAEIAQTGPASDGAN